MHYTKTVKGLLAVSAVVTLFSTASVQAQTQTNTPQSGNPSSSASNGKLSAGDQKAVKEMAQANINEIAAAKIALSKSQSADVKAFAQKMVADHGTAGCPNG
ncbi:putative outer membrane protein [Pantoea anthophila]|nr:putative outer membrane protein [Pantoea anthophila]